MAQEYLAKSSAQDAGDDRHHPLVDERKGCRPDGISVELFKITLNVDSALRRRLLDNVFCYRRRGGAPQQWKYAIIMVLQKKKDRKEGGNYRGIPLVAHAAKVLLIIIAHRLSKYCERVGILPEEQSGFRSNRYIVVMMFVIRRLQELARKKQIMLYVCFIHLTSAYGSVDRTFLWTILTRFDVSQNTISVIRQFHNAMQACVRLDDRVYSGWFTVKHSLRQVCVLVPLLVSMFFAAVINVTYTRFKEKKNIIMGLWYTRGTQKGAGGRGKATAGEPALATSL